MGVDGSSENCLSPRDTGRNGETPMVGEGPAAAARTDHRLRTAFATVERKAKNLLTAKTTKRPKYQVNTAELVKIVPADSQDTHRYQQQ